MNTKLSIVEPTALTTEDRNALDANIESLISTYKNNRQEINRLVFESVSAITAGEDYAQELARKKGLRRFIGIFTGSNKKLQDKINSSRTMAQYAAQQTLQRLAEQNLMSFDLITAVNNKLNASVTAIEQEFNDVYAVLINFFKQSRSDIVQLENRVEKLERNVKLLNWQNSIEYQMFDGVEYLDLDNTSKIVCLVRDFYTITQGNWTTSDLLLLKTAMGTIGISPRTPINYFKFITSIEYNASLRNYLLNGLQIAHMPEPYLVPLCGMKKLELLNNEEQYIVDTLSNELNSQGIQTNTVQLCEGLTKEYLRQQSDIEADTSVSSYDLVLDMLFNLQAADDDELLISSAELNAGETAKELDELFQKASELFCAYRPIEARPLLEQLSEAGYAKANVLLYWLLRDGYYENQQYIGDCNLANKYLEIGYDAGDCICSLWYAMFFCKPANSELAKQFLPPVQELAEKGDIFAEYTLGIAHRNSLYGEEDNLGAVQHFLHAYQNKFYLAAGSIFLRYYRGDKPFQKDWVQGELWAKEVLKYKCPKRVFDVAYMFISIEEYGCTDQNMQYSFYQKALELLEWLTELGHSEAPGLLGWMYKSGRGTEIDFKKAFSYYSLAAERGDAIGQCNLAIFYLNGRGVPANRDKAKYWFEQSVNQGYQRAIDMLKKHFG